MTNRIETVSRPVPTPSSPGVDLATFTITRGIGSSEGFRINGNSLMDYDILYQKPYMYCMHLGGCNEYREVIIAELKDWLNGPRLRALTRLEFGKGNVEITHVCPQFSNSIVTHWTQDGADIQGGPKEPNLAGPYAPNEGPIVAAIAAQKAEEDAAEAGAMPESNLWQDGYDRAIKDTQESEERMARREMAMDGREERVKRREVDMYSREKVLTEKLEQVQFEIAKLKEDGAAMRNMVETGKLVPELLSTGHFLCLRGVNRVYLTYEKVKAEAENQAKLYPGQAMHILLLIGGIRTCTTTEAIPVDAIVAKPKLKQPPTRSDDSDGPEED